MVLSCRRAVRRRRRVGLDDHVLAVGDDAPLALADMGDVAPGPAVEEVGIAVLGDRPEGVLARTTLQVVLAGPAVQRVVAGTAVDRVGTAATAKRVGAAVAEELIRAVAAADSVVPGLAVDDVEAAAAGDLVVPLAGVDHVRPAVAVDRVVAAEAVDQVRAGRTDDRVVARRAADDRGRCRRRQCQCDDDERDRDESLPTHCLPPQVVDDVPHARRRPSEGGLEGVKHRYDVGKRIERRLALRPAYAGCTRLSPSRSMMKRMGKRLRWMALGGLLTLVLVCGGAVAAIAAGGPRQLADYFFGPHLARAEFVLVMNGGQVHDFRIDRTAVSTARPGARRDRSSFASWTAPSS